MKDLERSKKLALKLFVPFCFDVFAIQPDFLAWSIATAFYFLIMGFLLQFLYIEKILTANFY